MTWDRYVFQTCTFWKRYVVTTFVRFFMSYRLRHVGGWYMYVRKCSSSVWWRHVLQLLNLWSDQAAVAGLFLGCSMLTFVSSKLDVIRSPLRPCFSSPPHSQPSCGPYSMSICCWQSMRKLDLTFNGFCRFIICYEQAYPLHVYS